MQPLNYADFKMKTEFQPHINLSSYTGRPVAILGLGKSGLSAAHVLKHHGADVRAWDDDPKRELQPKKMVYLL